MYALEESMNTSTSSKATIHIITASSDPAWRTYLVSALEALHPGADVKVGSGSFDDVFVWTTEMGVSPDLVMTTDVDDEERVSYSRLSRGSFDSAVHAAEDLAEQVESEIAKIKTSWKRRSTRRDHSSLLRRSNAAFARAFGSTSASAGLTRFAIPEGVLSVVVGLFR